MGGHENLRAPAEHHHGQQEGNDSPCDFEEHAAVDLLRPFARASPAIADREPADRAKDKQREKDSDADQEEDEVVHLRRHLRGCVRE